ncbi:hypothetical protein TNCV_3939061 [Trichonephila clavipes]|nr:hypothetical protein TNCV_3939061 [Trichonephila clavipes]
MCEPPNPSGGGVLHLIERCNPWNQSLAVALNIAEACQGATETSRNITTRVIERDTSGEIYYFLEDSRGFRTRQHGRQRRQNGRQSRQIGRLGRQK